MTERPIVRVSRGAAFALMGAFAMAAQTALFREYLVAYGGNELGTGVFFASWLAWVGAGALLSMVLLRRWRRYRGSFAAVLALYPPALLIQLVLIALLRRIAGVAPTDLFPMTDLFAWTFLTNAPVSCVTGALFPLAAAEAGGDPGRAVSRVYVLECLGAFAGGAGVTAALLAGSPALSVVIGLSALLAAAGVVFSLFSGRPVAVYMHWVMLVFVVVPTLAWGFYGVGSGLRGMLDRAHLRSTYPGAHAEGGVQTPYRRLQVATLGGQNVVLSNGRILTSWPGGDEALADAALLASQPRDLKRVLLVGSGQMSLTHELLRYPVERIVVVEPDRRGLEFLRRNRLRDPRLAALDDDRVEVRYGDVSAALEDEERFDLVVVDVGDPDTALAARSFTREFYERVRAVLSDGGVLATAITSAENRFGTEVTRYGASVLATLGTVFPKLEVTPGERAWFLAGGEDAPLTLDAEVLRIRLLGLDVRNRRFEPERIHQLLEPYRVEFARETYTQLPREERQALVSTEDRPQVYLLNLLVLGRRQEAGLSRLVLAIRDAGAFVLLLPILVILLVRLRYVLARPDPARSRRFCGAWLLLVVGAASISLDVALLLHFQQRFGLLFEKVGLANGLFMLGLFAGGLAASRLARWRPGSIGLLAGAAGGLAAAFALLLPSLWGAGIGEPGTLGLFLLTGALCGAPFPFAAHLLGSAGGDAGGTGGVLQCVDHMGGAVGAAIAGVLLVPLFGTAATVRVVGIVLLSAPALLLLEGAIVSVRLDGSLGPALGRIRARVPTFPFVRTGFVLLAVVLAVAAVSWPVRRELDRPLVRLDTERLRAAAPDAMGHLEREEPYLRYESRTEKDGPAVAHSLATRAIPVAVPGYGGPLNLLLSLGADGTVRRVALLESEETPAYIEGLPEFLARMEGQSADRDFRLVEEGEAESGHDIVNITGATVTCRASVETVNRAKNRMLADLLGRAPPGAVEEPATRWASAEIATLALFVLAVPVFLRGGSRLRLGFLVVVLVVLGVLENQQLSAGRVMDLLDLSLPPLGNLPHFVLVTGALLLAVVFGQVYCGLLCPFGAAQELLGRLGLRRQASPDLDRRARFVKHGVLAVTAVGVLLLGSEAILDYDPLGIVFSGKATSLMWALVGLVLVLSLFHFRFWCRYLCPVGAFLSLFNRVALLRRIARRKAYARCDLGVRSASDLDCIQCNRCLGGGTEETP